MVLVIWGLAGEARNNRQSSARRRLEIAGPKGRIPRSGCGRAGLAGLLPCSVVRAARGKKKDLNMTESTADIGLIGLAVMGQNLVMNMADHGFTVAVFNRTVSKVEIGRAHV